MRNLHELLKRFSTSLDKNTEQKKAVVDVIKQKIGIELSPEKLNLKNGVLEIISSPTVNNELKLKETSILDELRSSYKLNVVRVTYR